MTHRRRSGTTCVDLGCWFALVIGSSCIIPDREIVLESKIANPGAVRVLERPPTDPQMYTACNFEDEDDDDALDEDFRFCPPVPRSSRSAGLIRGGPFCVCPQGSDDNAIPTFTIYAEDPDLDGDDPEDQLYGVLSLDVDPSSTSPQKFVAYETYLEPCAPGIPVVLPLEITLSDESLDRTVPSQSREPPAQWAFVVNDASGSGVIDLCNDNQGGSPGVGLHDLQFMVTDRPYFEAPFSSDSGEEEDEQRVAGRRQCGVPDLSIGATYAVSHYVFECVESTTPGCRCVENEP